MDSDVAAGLAGFSLIIFLFALLLAILWILVPFAIFGIKPLLKQLIVEQQRTQKLLEAAAVQRPAVVVPTATVAPMPEPDNRTLGEMISDPKR